MIDYKFLLTVKRVNKQPSPSSPIKLNIGDTISGDFSLDVNNPNIPPDFIGCDSSEPFGFKGKSIICKTDFNLHSFCVESRILKSVTFMGDLDYLLVIDFYNKSFFLHGSDIDSFEYSGEISHFHVKPQYNFLLKITEVITPPSAPSINLKIGDTITGNYFVDTGAVPAGYTGSDSGFHFGFKGKTTICNTLYQLHTFSIQNPPKIKTIVFLGDLSYMLKLDLDRNTFELFGDDIVRFNYRGIIERISPVTDNPKAPTGLKVVVT